MAILELTPANRSACLATAVGISTCGSVMIVCTTPDRTQIDTSDLIEENLHRLKPAVVEQDAVYEAYGHPFNESACSGMEINRVSRFVAAFRCVSVPLCFIRPFQF